MDGYATGTAGAGGNKIANFDVTKTLIQTKLSKLIYVRLRNCVRIRPLIVVIQPHLSSTAGFDPEGALAWRSTNFALGKSIEVFEHVQGLFESAYDICMAACIIPVTPVCPVCVPFGFLESITENAIFAVVLALDISEHVYGEIVDGQDGDAAAEQDSAVYENVITIHGNVIATHTLLSQMYNFVSGSQTGASSRRRLQVIDCTNTTLAGYVDNCSKPSCENPTKLCDGSFNYEYISQLEGGEYHNRTMGYLRILSRAAHTKLSYLLSPQLAATV